MSKKVDHGCVAGFNRIILTELYETKHKSVTSYGVHTLCSTCKRHYWHSDFGYGMFSTPALHDNDVLQINTKFYKARQPWLEAKLYQQVLRAWCLSVLANVST